MTAWPIHPLTRIRHRLQQRGAGLLAAVLVLAGCQAPPPTVPATAMMPPPVAQPPPPPLPPAPEGWDGEYAGVGHLLVAPGGQLDCPRRISITGMRVSEGRARFGSYRGRIGPDGSVRMAFRQSWITGRLAGERFEGTLFQPYPGAVIGSCSTGSPHAEPCLPAAPRHRRNAFGTGGVGLGYRATPGAAASL